MNTTHSPLPWFLQDTTKDPVAKNRRLTIATDPKHVSAVASVCRRIGMEAEDKANAQFIVTACNSHAALLEALETLQSVVRAVDSPVVFPGWEERRQEALAQARQALALAKGVQP